MLASACSVLVYIFLAMLSIVLLNLNIIIFLDKFMLNHVYYILLIRELSPHPDGILVYVHNDIISRDANLIYRLMPFKI